MSRRGEFAEDERRSTEELLALIARQAAELDALKRISLNLTSRLELGEVLETVAKEAMGLVKDARNINIFLFDENGPTFGAALDDTGEISTVFAPPRPNGLTNTVARSRKIVMVDDMRRHPLYADAPELWSGSIIGIPLSMGDRVVGVMNLARHKAGPFSAPEIRLLELLADQAAIAIVNARLHEAVGAQAKDLEMTVRDRTVALEKSNAELSANVSELRAMRDQMIQQEKMAALGGMVSGVAHEINTPIGNSITAASYLEQAVGELERKFSDGTLDRRSMNEFLAQCKEISQITLVNLRRAAELVASFKKVAVDQEVDVQSRFSVREYLESILISLRPSLKSTKIEVALECSDDLAIRSYPGALSQIVTNLVMNSLMHAYSPGSAGRILIRAAETDGQLILEYSDDGGGMSEETAKRIFEPFYTTKRGKGGVGLGMYIVYNMVTQKLNGTIEIGGRPGEGMTCTIRVPTGPGKNETKGKTEGGDT